MMSLTRRAVLASLGLSLPAGLLLVGRGQAQEVRFLRLGTGPIGGTYFPIGGLIANVISGPPGAMACELGGSCGVPGLIATAVATQGSVQNLQGIAARTLELALCQADLAHDAFHGKRAYSGRPLPMLRSIANLFEEAAHIVVRSETGIKTVSELKGRKVGVGEPNSGTQTTAIAILRAYGMTMKEIVPVHEKLARAMELLATGDIDAFVMVGGPPLAAVAYVAERQPIGLLPVSEEAATRALQAQPLFIRTTIPADIYAGVPETPTIGVNAQLLTSEKVDADLIAAITRALWDPRNRKVFLAGSPSARRILPETARVGLSVPLHPGALRYYETRPAPGQPAPPPAAAGGDRPLVEKPAGSERPAGEGLPAAKTEQRP